MPYLDETDRERVHKHRASLPGDIAYEIVQLYNGYTYKRNKLSTNFETMAGFFGGVILGLLDIWDRKVSPYEKEKCRINGDVYD